MLNVKMSACSRLGYRTRPYPIFTTRITNNITFYEIRINDNSVDVAAKILRNNIYKKYMIIIIFIATFSIDLPFF